MNKKSLLLFAVIIAVIAGIVIFFQSGTKESVPSNGSSGLIIGKNAIYAPEQLPGNEVLVSVVRLEKSGFAAIHEDASGAPGKILGTSSLLPAGETKNLEPIKLSQPTKDEETIYAMLHFDNGNAKFDASLDRPALDSISGEPVMMIVTVSKDALEPAIINP